MSHDDLAAGKARGAARRKVSYSTTFEDLEGRVLLSAVRHVRATPALIRQANRPRPNLQANAHAKQLQARAHAQVQIPRRLQAMNALRMRNPTINIQQSVNVNPTVNVAPATATSNSTSTPATTNNNNSAYHEALAAAGVSPPSTGSGAGSGASTSTSTGTSGVSTTSKTPPSATTPPSTSTTPPATASPPSSTPANPSGQQGSGTWTSINNPPANPTTPPSQTGTSPGSAGSNPTTPPVTPTTPPAPTNPPPVTPPPTPPAPTFPDGTILRNEQTGERAWYSGAARHLISPPVATKMGLTPAQETVVTANVFKAVPKGNDYFPDGMFVRNEQSNEVSRYSGGAFHVVSQPILTKLGLGSNDYATISAAQYAGVNKGPDYFPEGILLQNQQSNEVDIYQGGQRHWISAEVAKRINMAVGSWTTISPTQFNAIPQGKDYFPDNTFLLNQDTSEIAFYSGGKNHLVSAPVAAKLGPAAMQVISVSSAQYNAIDKGPDYFVEGMFLQNNQTNEVDQYSGGQRHWVSSPVATAINLTPAQITTIGADQFNNIPRGGDYTPPPPSATAPVPGAKATA